MILDDDARPQVEPRWINGYLVQLHWVRKAEHWDASWKHQLGIQDANGKPPGLNPYFSRVGDRRFGLFDDPEEAFAYAAKLTLFLDAQPLIR